MIYNLADLFCGAGGTSTGAIEALEILGHQPKLTAINHWPVAVATHESNHPNARHLCASLDSLNPRDLFKDDELSLLWASPECTHHSQARGGKPIHDQSRATAWCVVRWAEALRPKTILVENVPEFETWGPLNAKGRPIAGKKGQVFQSWLQNLRALGYTVDHRVLCAADYGDPTTRRRLFIQAQLGRRKIVWPDATHAPAKAEADMFSARKPWVPAKAIIDWDTPGTSIYNRKRPLSPKTMARIYAGLRKFGLKPQPFIITMEHGGSVRSADRPLPTITTAKGGAMAMAQPFLIHTAHGVGGVGARSVNEPMPTVAGNRGDMAVCEPHLLPQHAGSISRPVTQPAPTVTTDGAIALVEPYLVKYYGTGVAKSIHETLDAATTKQRFGLARPEVVVDGERYLLDIRFRMLHEGELAAAQGFRSDYKFTGNKTEIVKQIGNAVPRRLARALCLAAVGQSSDITQHIDKCLHP